jgi:tetratricopeptide (TPR) repeat protein
VQCLYCGKGIGPIRQLRDLEFCSEAHRTEFRERYRKTLYEALAPEPAPVRSADFIERAPARGGPAPRAALRPLSKFLPEGCKLAVDIQRARISAERSDFVFGDTLAAMRTRLVWQDIAAACPRPIPSASFPVAVEPLGGSAAGAAATDFLAANCTSQPLAATTRIPQPSRLLYTVSLPEAARNSAPVQAGPRSPQLHANGLVRGVLSVTGPVAHAVRDCALPGSTTIARPAAPGGTESAPEVSLAPASIGCQPRLLEAGAPAMLSDFETTAVPVAFEAPGARGKGIVLPRLHTAAASSTRIASIEHLQPVRPEPRLPVAAKAATGARADLVNRSWPMPDIQAALPTVEQIESAARRPLGLAPMAPTADPQPAEQPAASPSCYAARTELSSNPLGPLGSHAYPQAECSAPAIAAPAGLVQPANPLVQEAAGNRNLRAAVAAAPARFETPVPRHELSALPGTLLGAAASAPIRQVDAPAAPPKAAPSCDPARAASPDHTLIPLPDMVLPRIDYLAAPAGAVGGFGALRPDVGRAVRSCAVLWTLRVAHMLNPVFRVDPVKSDFNDLLRADENAPYVQDLAVKRAVKSNVLPFKRERVALPRPTKWMYIGAAAAALLLAGVLHPQVAPKGFGGSFPWRGISIGHWMSQRATRVYADDFRAGLDQWKSVQPQRRKGWSYSSDGFIHPGQLALYSPSVKLSDYRFEFMAQVENKSVDWVVRARDADNYYAMKFTVLQPGPRPIVAMVRYPVIEGRKGNRVQTPLRMMIHANTPYRITVDVKGNRYRTYIEGQEADYWTEDRLKAGGVGFFREPGELARVYWVKVESQGDTLGRICGWLSKSSEGATDQERKAMDYRNMETTEIKTASVKRSVENGNGRNGAISRVLSKAASLHLDGKLAEAAKELVRTLDGGERHAALFFALGQLQYELQEYGPAAHSYEQAAQLEPLHPTAHFNAGVCLGRLERWEEAAASFRKALSNDPARSEAHLALGACLVQAGLHNEALEAYDRFLARHPDDNEALFGKAVALQKRDRSSEAAELYRRILSRNPNSEDALSNLVSLSLANQDYELVRKYAQRLAEAQPNSQIALEGLAGAAFAAGDHRSAAEYSRKLAELAPQVFENWFNLGVACHKAGDLANAAEAYTRATRVRPDSPQAHLNLGVSLQEQGDLKGARAAYERAVAIDPKLPGVHWNLGLVHEQLGDLDAAEKLYAQVPENSPDSDDAAFRIGHLRLQRSDYPGSIAAFEACLQKRPNWPEARLNLGIAHWRAGNKDAAKTCFQELTASGSDSKEALRGLAALALDQQDYDKAFEIYRQLLDSGDRSPELLYNAGLICQRRGEAEDAAVLYREAIRTDPQFGEALLNLGHALMSLGNEFEARSCWRKAVIAKPELAQRYFEPAAQAS